MYKLLEKKLFLFKLKTLESRGNIFRYCNTLACDEEILLLNGGKLCQLTPWEIQERFRASRHSFHMKS